MSARLTRWRAALGRRSAREGANLGITALLLLAVLVGVNYVANRRNATWDLTAGGQFSLSPQTVRILEELDRDVRLVVLDQPRAAGRTIELFERYADRSDRVAWEVIDQEAEPARARAYQATAEAGIPFGTVVVESGGRQERVTAPQEQDITNAIVKILKGETKKVYFTTGHQERSLEESGTGGLSAIGSRLEESNYEVAELSLLEHVEDGEVRIPEDAAVVIVAGPRLDLLEAEAAALAAHVRAGGKAMLLLDPPDPPGIPDDRDELTGLASEFGAIPAGDVVIDASGVGQLFGFGVEVPLAASYGFHPITRGFVNAATVFPLAQSLIATPPDELPRGMRLSELVLSSDVSWGEDDADELETGEVAAGEDERTGPLRLAYAVHVPTGDQEPPAEEAGAGEQDLPEPRNGPGGRSRGRVVRRGTHRRPGGPPGDRRGLRLHREQPGARAARQRRPLPQHGELAHGRRGSDRDPSPLRRGPAHHHDFGAGPERRAAEPGLPARVLPHLGRHRLVVPPVTRGRRQLQGKCSPAG